ncbi:MAG: TolC family protein, partial [Bacteroidia bacterium]|nr:TolC family protein [Bacteroidia bacterium]
QLASRNYGPYAGLSLNVPIYNGSSLKRQEKVAALATRNASLDLEILRQDREAALWRSWQTYQNALMLLENEAQNVALSRRLLDLMVQKYSLRQATILELKQAQNSFEESGYRLVNLEFAAKAAEIELRRLGGKLR